MNGPKLKQFKVLETTASFWRGILNTNQVTNSGKIYQNNNNETKLLALINSLFKKY